MVHRKYRDHASHTIVLLLLFASNGNVLVQKRWIAKNFQAGCALMAQGVLRLLFGSDSPTTADPQMAITFDAEMLPWLLALHRREVSNS